MVSVGDLAHLTSANGTRSIDRVDRQTVVHVSANVAPGSTLSECGESLQRQLAAGLPASVRVSANPNGTQQNLTDTMRGMAVALAPAWCWSSCSWSRSTTATARRSSSCSRCRSRWSARSARCPSPDESLNAFSLIGTVLLIGLVTKNGILLVDYANQLRERGMERWRPSARAPVRFRPIVMTTAAMVFGMMPLALGFDHAVQSRKSLGIVVIGGLISSLLLTLILIPVVYVRLSPQRLRQKPRWITSDLYPVGEEVASERRNDAGSCARASRCVIGR